MDLIVRELVTVKKFHILLRILVRNTDSRDLEVLDGIIVRRRAVI
jgi:hypothetical protein